MANAVQDRSHVYGPADPDRFPLYCVTCCVELRDVDHHNGTGTCPVCKDLTSGVAYEELPQDDVLAEAVAQAVADSVEASR